MNAQPTQAHRILLVDDDPDHLALCKRWLELEGYAVDTAGSGPEGLACLARTRPDLVVSDLIMGDMNGLKLLSEIHRQDPVLPTMIMSGKAGLPDALQAAHLGVSGFLEKPFAKQSLLDAVAGALDDLSTPPPLTGELITDAGPLVYRSALMQELVGRVHRVALTDSTVMINGETGTGKELFARAIHEVGERRNRPFISINCSALPEQLLESELFGHEKGAFTGATARHIGLFQAADGGTLFLDEIGDMPLPLQAKVLRVLQDFAVRPVGGLQTVDIDVRVISATHQPLQELVANKQFREDLYYRLNVVPLVIPPLRDRPDDILMLAEHLLTVFADKAGNVRKHLAPDARSVLQQARFPGNVRQLRNVIERCVVLSNGPVIPRSLVIEALEDQTLDLPSLDEARDAFERRYLAGLLRATNGNISAAAKTARRNRTEFYNLLARHHLEPGDFRQRDE